MKKVLFFSVLAVTLLFSACGDKDAANALADEMCTVMESYDESDPMALMEAAGKMVEIASKEEYKDVSEANLIAAMKEKCPEGAEKFIELSAKGDE